MIERGKYLWPNQSGLYHLTAEGEVSWYDDARQAGSGIRVASDAVTPIFSRYFPTAAIRPHNSRLDKSKLKKPFDLQLPDWQSGVARVMGEILR